MKCLTSIFRENYIFFCKVLFGIADFGKYWFYILLVKENYHKFTVGLVKLSTGGTSIKHQYSLHILLGKKLYSINIKWIWRNLFIKIILLLLVNSCVKKINLKSVLMYSITVSITVCIYCCTLLLLWEKQQQGTQSLFRRWRLWIFAIKRLSKVTCVRTMVEEEIESRTGLEKTLVEFHKVNKKWKKWRQAIIHLLWIFTSASAVHWQNIKNNQIESQKVLPVILSWANTAH